MESPAGVEVGAHDLPAVVASEGGGEGRAGHVDPREAAAVAHEAVAAGAARAGPGRPIASARLGAGAEDAPRRGSTDAGSAAEPAAPGRPRRARPGPARRPPSRRPSRGPTRETCESGCGHAPSSSMGTTSPHRVRSPAPIRFTPDRRTIPPGGLGQAGPDLLAGADDPLHAGARPAWGGGRTEEVVAEEPEAHGAGSRARRPRPEARRCRQPRAWSRGDRGARGGRCPSCPGDHPRRADPRGLRRRRRPPRSSLVAVPTASLTEIAVPNGGAGWVVAFGVTSRGPVQPASL